jgi:DNA-directed RNA polymerase beta subunit
MLLSPIIKRIATITKQVWRGIKYDKLNLDQLVLLKYFLASKNPDMKIDGLSGNFLYSTTNLYSALLKNKISMVPPGVEDAPRSVQTIHPTHYGRICPISISSQNAGHIVSILSGTKINELGLFHFD